MLRLSLWGIDVKVSIGTGLSWREPSRFFVGFDSLEELKAAVVIITMHNLSSLYKVIVRDAEECYRVVSFTLGGPTITTPSLTFKGFVTGGTLQQLKFLEEKLRRSYEQGMG